jgi:hypothetical protein
MEDFLQKDNLKTLNSIEMMIFKTFGRRLSVMPSVYSEISVRISVNGDLHHCMGQRFAGFLVLTGR